MIFRVSVRPLAASLTAAVIALAATAYTQEQPLAGTWVGTVYLGGEAQFALLDLPSNPADKGTLQFPFAEQRFEVTEMRRSGAQLSLSAQSAGATLKLSGTVESGIWTGAQPDTTGSRQTFGLAHLAPVNLARLTGAFRTDTGALLSISPLPDQSLGPMAASVAQYVDTRTGRWGTLFAISPTRFISGPALARPFPIEVEINALAERRGVVSSLTWAAPGQRPLKMKRVEFYREEDVSFRNGSVTLAGTLSRPERRGPLPAVVLTHGSGAQLRQRGVMEHLFLAAGFAVLTYDKRGVGKSSGTLDGASFDDLAGDAVAGARLLQTRPDINHEQIGFWGLSQGGWIAPLAAATFGNSAFVIGVSGGGLSPDQQELFDTEEVLRQAAFSEAEIAEALSFQRARNAYLRTGTDWETYLAARRAARGKRWYAYGNTDAFGPLTVTDPYWDRQRNYYFYDPSQTLQRLTCPALFVFGALDAPSGVRANVNALQRARQGAASNSIELRVVSNAGHNLFVAESDPNKALLEMSLYYAPGYPQQLVQWASTVLRAAKPTAARR